MRRRRFRPAGPAPHVRGAVLLMAVCAGRSIARCRELLGAAAEGLSDADVALIAADAEADGLTDAQFAELPEKAFQAAFLLAPILLREYRATWRDEQPPAPPARAIPRRTYVQSGRYK